MRKVIWTIVSVLILVGALGLVGCGDSNIAERTGKIRIVTTTGMITDAAQHIGGDKVTVDGLMGPGVDPHLYKATKGDIDLLHEADVVFYNGLFLEAKMSEILDRMGGPDKAVVGIGDAVDSSKLRFPSHFKGHPDPHIWFDLPLWKQAVAQLAEALVQFDTTNAGYYRANAEAYLDSISVLHEWVKQQIEAIPKEQRVMITAHDAFEYFGREYGLEVRGLQGISTVTEAGLQDITTMVDYLSERKIKAVFVETSVPRKTIEAVVDGCRAKGHEIKIGGELFSDAMGQGGTPEGTYLGMVRHNVNTIVQALK